MIILYTKFENSFSYTWWIAFLPCALLFARFQPFLLSHPNLPTFIKLSRYILFSVVFHCGSHACDILLCNIVWMWKYWKIPSVCAVHNTNVIFWKNQFGKPLKYLIFVVVETLQRRFRCYCRFSRMIVVVIWCYHFFCKNYTSGLYQPKSGKLLYVFHIEVRQTIETPVYNV